MKGKRVMGMALLKINSGSQRVKQQFQMKCLDKANFAPDQEGVPGTSRHTKAGSTWRQEAHRFLLTQLVADPFPTGWGGQSHNLIQLPSLKRIGAQEMKEE